MHPQSFGAIRENVERSFVERRGVGSLDLPRKGSVIIEMPVEGGQGPAEASRRRELCARTGQQAVERRGHGVAIEDIHNARRAPGGHRAGGEKVRKSPGRRHFRQIDSKQDVEVRHVEPVGPRLAEPREEREEPDDLVEIGELGEIAREGVVVRVDGGDRREGPGRLPCPAARAGRLKLQPLGRRAHPRPPHEQRIALLRKNQIDAVRVEPEPGLLTRNALRTGVCGEPLEVRPETGQALPHALAHIAAFDDVDSLAEGLESHVAQEAHESQARVSQAPAVVHESRLRSPATVEAHVGLARPSVKDGAVRDGKVGEGDRPAEEPGLRRPAAASDERDAAARLETRSFEPQTFVEKLLPRPEIEGRALTAGARVLDLRAPGAEAQMKERPGGIGRVRMDLNIERVILRAVACRAREPAALRRQDVAQNGPCGAPRLLRSDLARRARRRVDHGVRLAERLVRRERHGPVGAPGRPGDADPQTSSAVAFDNVAARPNQLDPRGLRLARVPETADIDERQPGHGRDGIKNVRKNKGVRLEQGIEKHVRDRIVRPSCRRRRRPALEVLQERPDRLARVAETSPVQPVDPDPAAGDAVCRG